MRLKSFEAIVEALNVADVRYLVAGGLAVNAHGYLRFTKDVDLVVALEPGRFVSIPTLIRMKESSDRPQDRVDIQYLRMRQVDDGTE